MKKKTTVKRMQEKKAQPGQLLYARERKIVSSSPHTLDDARAGRFVMPGQACMIVGVINTQFAGESIELHGVMTAGTAAVGWIMLPPNKAQSFWAA